VTVKRGVVIRTVGLGDEPEVGTSCPFCTHGRVTALVGTVCARCLAIVSEAVVVDKGCDYGCR